MVTLHRGMSRREAFELLRNLGGDVRLKRGTGEVICSHPNFRRTLTLSIINRVKDAPLKLIVELKYLLKYLMKA